MDQSKLAILGTLGLATLGICVAIVMAGRYSSPAARKAKSLTGSATRLGSSSSTQDADGAQGVVNSDKALDGTDGNSPGRKISSREDPATAVTETGGTATPRESRGAAEEGREQLVTRFNKANSKAKKFFTGQRYKLAAEQYSIALQLCDSLPNHDSKLTALYNNRGAAYEKAGEYALSLADCSICLSRDVGHKFARVRKSRVLEAMGKEEDALSEVCAHLLLERDRVQAKAALSPSEPLTPPPPPPNLEGLLRKVASKRADEILQEREQAAAKEQAQAAAGGGGGGAVPVKRKPLVKQAVTELLRSFGSFGQLERVYKGMQEAAITRELKVAEEKAGEGGDESRPSPSDGAAAAVSRVSSLFDRGMVRLTKGNYDASREDIFEAGKLLSTLIDAGAKTTEGEAEIPPELETSVWMWYGTFLQLSGELDEAVKAYERCGKAAEAQGKPCPADCLIKMAWVRMEKEDTEAAKALFARAMELHPDYGTSFAHRARLDAEKDGMAAVKEFLEKAIQLNDKDAFAWEQLGRVHVEAGDIAKATETIEDGLKSVPMSDALLTLKAELKYTMAMKAGDPSSCIEIQQLFDEAIRANTTNPVLYINKASFLLQMMSDVDGAMEMLEKGVSVDPTSVNALVQLANLKIMVAREIADAEAATALIDKAVTLCNTKEELMETLSVRVATEGRIKGALLLGRTTLG